MTKVFLSHASSDRAEAEDLCRSLEYRGVTCWMAPRDIPPGAIYSGAIIEAIDNCRALVFLLSRSSNASSNVLREVERASSKGKSIFPVRIADVAPCKDLEFFVSLSQSIDFLEPPFDEQKDRLAAALGSPGSSKPSLEERAPRLRGKPSKLLLCLTAIVVTLLVRFALDSSEVTGARPLTLSELTVVFIVALAVVGVFRAVWQRLITSRDGRRVSPGSGRS